MLFNSIRQLGMSMNEYIPNMHSKTKRVWWY